MSPTLQWKIIIQKKKIENRFFRTYMNSKFPFSQYWFDLQFNYSFYRFCWSIFFLILFLDWYYGNCFNLIFWQANYYCAVEFFSLKYQYFLSSVVVVNLSFEINDVVILKLRFSLGLSPYFAPISEIIFVIPLNFHAFMSNWVIRI